LTGGAPGRQEWQGCCDIPGQTPGPTQKGQKRRTPGPLPTPDPSRGFSAFDRGLSFCAREARRHDNDRFLACLFAPEDRHEALFALLAFNLEIAKTREVVTEPLIGQMRLQWWRDAVERLYQPSDATQPPPAHEVVRSLALAISRHSLSREHFDRLIDARDADLSDTPPASLDALRDYAEATSAPLVRLGLEVLGLRSWRSIEQEAAIRAAREVAIAWALTGLLRAVPFLIRQRRIMLPADLLARHGLKAARLFDFRPDPLALAPVVAEVAAAARVHLSQARRLRPKVPAAAIPALLPATLADHSLSTLERHRHDVFSLPLHRHPLRPLWLAWRAWRQRY
jgi:NADH dehydrogenase [ubiquinone] 1 alpha subcomplex assembly factor 6